MRNEQFAAASKVIAIMGGLAMELDLPGYLEHIAQTLETGPTNVPASTWEKAEPRLRELHAIASSLVAFQALSIAGARSEMEAMKKPRIIVPGLNDG